MANQNWIDTGPTLTVSCVHTPPLREARRKQRETAEYEGRAMLALALQMSDAEAARMVIDPVGFYYRVARLSPFSRHLLF